MSTSSSLSASATTQSASVTQTADAASATTGQLGLFTQSICSAAALGAVCLVIHIGTFIATLVVTSRAGKRGGGTLLLLAFALWVLAFANEACTLGFYQTAVTHGDKTTETAYQFLADNQAGSWNVGILVTGFLTALLTDGYLLVRCYQWWTHESRRVLYPLAALTLICFGWDLAEVAYTAGHPQGSKSEWIMPGFGSWPVTVALSGCLHLIFSSLLGYRVVNVSRKMLGKRPTVWSVIVEAAVPYTVVSTIFMAVYCADIDAANVFGAMVVQFQGIAVDLIIIRMMKAGPTELTPALLPTRHDLEVSRSAPPMEATSTRSMIEFATALSKEDKVQEKKWSMALKSPSPSDDPLPAYSP